MGAYFSACCLLLVFRQANDLVLILYLATLLNVVNWFKCFLMESLGSIIYNPIPSVNEIDCLLPVCNPSILAFPKPCCNVLNESGESRYPCPVPDFSGDALRFPPT